MLPLRPALAASLAGALLALAACRIESVAPGAAPGPDACGDSPRGELWVYTSMYPAVVDGIEALARERLPELTLRWFKAGSEKVANRLEGEFAAGGTRADVLAVSDPFLYERFKREQRLQRHAPPDALRIPRSLVDPDGHYVASRVSTMVLAFRDTHVDPPVSFAELAQPKWRGRVALGDPLVSGTAFSWAAFIHQSGGDAYFRALRDNAAVVAGGNAAVQARIETGEADVGVLLLENVLLAREKGSRLAFRYPDDGAVTIPGYIGIFRGSRNPSAARAFVDLVLSPEAQALMVRPGFMHAADPRQPGPAGEGGLDALLARTRTWDEAMLARGISSGAAIKSAFAEAFSQ